VETSNFSSLRTKPNDPNETRIEFGFRGENLIYHRTNRVIEVTFTFINGFRIYTDDIKKWKDGSALIESEQEKVFNDLIIFINEERGKPVIVINKDDPSKNLWERLCKENQSLIGKSEYTSDEEGFQFRQKMFLDILKHGKKLKINDVEIANEKDLDKTMERLKRKR
jgi:hypothetical protein